MTNSVTSCWVSDCKRKTPDDPERDLCDFHYEQAKKEGIC